MREELNDTIELDIDVSPESVRDALIRAVNLAWQRQGEWGYCAAPANFVGWLIQEYDRLSYRADAAIAKRKE